MLSRTVLLFFFPSKEMMTFIEKSKDPFSLFLSLSLRHPLGMGGRAIKKKKKLPGKRGDFHDKRN